jgi:tRNA(Ile)-lysidine synthase
MDIRFFHRMLSEASRNLIPHETLVVCAVSGGADSMAMLHGLEKVNEIQECGWRLCVAHLDHGLPCDSADVERFVRQTADSLALPYYSEAADVPRLSQQSRLSIEEAGRKVRYEFLRRSAAHFGARFICTAHHADDQVETVLHRIIRGTGLSGLGGIPESRILEGDLRVVRPLLRLSRNDLRAYLSQRHLAHMEDTTNGDLKAAMRNRIRHELLPGIISEYNPGIARALLRLSRQAQQAAEVMRELADQHFVRALESIAESMITLRGHELSDLPCGLQSEIVRLTIDRLDCPRKGIGANRIEAAAALLRGSGKKRRVEAPGLLIERQGRFVRFIKQGNLSADASPCGPSRKETPA